MKEKSVFQDKKVSIIGAGISGTELALLAAKLGAEVFISDCGEICGEKKALFDMKGIKWEAGANTESALAADLVVVSSGISPEVPILRKSVAKGVPVVGELDFVYPYLSGRIIAVTGSNGKTTTASMAGFFLEKLGCNCLTGGNIGNAAAKAAGVEYDYIVLELSSFQLHWAEKFKADVSIVTNLAPDHINWHGSYENYVGAKAKAAHLLRRGGKAIYQLRDGGALRAFGGLPLSWSNKVGSDGILLDEDTACAWLVYEGVREKLFDFSSVKLLGRHNLENAAMSVAALACCGIRVPEELIARYSPPPHRCAPAGKLRGVSFVDDSKGTNVAAAVAAMNSLPGRKVIILGGKGKGEDYAPLAEAVKQYASWAVLLGAEKEKIAEALGSAGFNNFCFVRGMDEAVKTAYAKALAGETVLLSPACTSWDMYPDYGARGDHFVSAVSELIRAEG